MKKIILIVTVLLFAVGINKVAKAKDNESSNHNLQINIPEMTLISLASSGSGNSISLNPLEPSEAGLGVDFSKAVNNELWLNYSSVAKKNKLRNIAASISGDLPGGTSISVEASSPEGNGYGELGTATTGPQVLTNKDVTIVSEIGSCFTGTGSNNGSNLTYRLNMDDTSYAGLLNGNYSVTVTYTISEK